MGRELGQSTLRQLSAPTLPKKIIMKSAANTIQGVRKGRAKPCDVCRRRKVKCDGNASNSTACSSCKSLKVACTYNGSRDTEGYIKNLELEVQRLKSTLGKVQAYHSSIGLSVGGSDLPNSHQVGPGTPAEPTVLTDLPIPVLQSCTTHEDDILAMLTDDIMQLPSEAVSRASSSAPSPPSIRVVANADPSGHATLPSTPTPPPSRSISTAPPSAGTLPNIRNVHFSPSPSPQPPQQLSSDIFYNHIPGTSLLDDEPEWRIIEQYLQMWSAQARFAWDEWDSYTASISALSASLQMPHTR